MPLQFNYPESEYRSEMQTRFPTHLHQIQFMNFLAEFDQIQSRKEETIIQLVVLFEWFLEKCMIPQIYRLSYTQFLKLLYEFKMKIY